MTTSQRSLPMVDCELVRWCVASCPYVLNGATLAFRNDREIVKKALMADPRMFKSLRKELRYDRELVMVALMGYPSAVCYTDPTFRKDREVMLHGVGQHCEQVLLYAHPDLIKDRAFVLEAVKRCGHSLRFFGRVMRNDREIVMLAVKNQSWQYAGKQFMGDHEFMLEALKIPSFLLIFVDESIRNDLEIITQAVKCQPKRCSVPNPNETW